MGPLEQIKERYPFLTRKQREVADYMLEDAERMNYVTLKEMSQELSITEMTILKTCSALGFTSFSDMKYEFRKYSARQLELYRHQVNEYGARPAPAYELGDKGKLLREICGEEEALVAAFFRTLPVEKLFQAAELLLGAEQVLLCGRGISYNVCDFLAMRLAMLGLAAVKVNTEVDDSVHAALPLLGKPGTVLVAVSYPDYFRTTTKLTEYARKKEAPILAVTDQERSPVAALADLALLTPTHTRMFLNTLSAPMALANMLTTAANILLSGTRDTALDEFYRLFPERAVEDEETIVEE